MFQEQTVMRVDARAAPGPAARRAPDRALQEGIVVLDMKLKRLGCCATWLHVHLSRLAGLFSCTLH